MSKQPVALIILDGFGVNENHEKGVNAIFEANTPNLDRYFKTYNNSLIAASGMDVGLPEGQMGNSEVGHTNIGAGRIVYQELTRITKSIEDKEMPENETIKAALANCVDKNSALHLMGLLSDGGVHSHINHLYGLINCAKDMGIEKVYVHCFLDGRDVPPSSGADFVAQLEEKLKEIGVGKIASVMGRYYAMDRDNRWDRVEKAYDAIALAKGETAKNALEAVKNSYAKDITDEFVVPTVIEGAGVKEEDSVIFFNFRPDRAREITRCFVDPEFTGFKRELIKPTYVCMTQYDASMPNVTVAYKPQTLDNTLGEILSKNGLKQLRIAETEKYAHVTFFFNGGVETVSDGEDRALIPSPKVATYDLKPEMSAFEVKDEMLKRLDSDLYDVIILNFANCDMVGHTGDFNAAVKAVEAVDTCLGEVVDKIVEMGGVALITADHGNADQMLDPVDGGAFTAHTTNLVPLILAGMNREIKNGRLADLAPTMLEILGIEKPVEMTGTSLLK